MDYGAFWGPDQDLYQLVLTSEEIERCNAMIEEVERQAPGYKPQSDHFQETYHGRLVYYEQQQGWIRDLMSLDFGSLSHVSLDTNVVHCRNHADKNRRMVRRDLDGKEDLAYESCKFDMRRNPLPHRPGNWDPLHPPTTFSKEDRFLARMAYFPYCTGLQTVGPLQLKPKARFAMPRVQQTCPITKVWNVPELRATLFKIGHLYASFPALANLGRTCQAFFADISGDIMCLDTSSGRFRHLDKSDAEMDALVQRGKISQEERLACGAAPFLAVMPVRPRLTKTADFVPNRWNAAGWYDPTGLVYAPEKVTQQLYSLQQVFKTVLYHGSSIRNLQLHRVAFLDVKGVQAIVSGTPNLESLGIYNCELLHVGTTEALLNYVGAVNESRRPGGKLIDFDFSPRYHLGPYCSRTGSYGATWSDPHEIPNSSGTMVLYDSARGLAVIGLRAARLARKFGFELFQHHKAFRGWWERIPFGYGQSSEIANAIMNILDFEKNGEAQAGEVYFKFEEPEAFDRLYQAMKYTVHLDLLISASGTPQKPSILDQKVYMDCAQCGETLHPGFFDDSVKWRRPEHRVCIGCQFQAYVANERDHQKLFRRTILGSLWQDGPSPPTVQWVLHTAEGRANWANAKAMALQLQDELPQKYLALLHDNEKALEELQPRQLDARNRSERDALRAQIKKAKAYVKEAKVFLNNEQEDPIAGHETTRNWDFQRKWYFYRQRMERGGETNDGPHFIWLNSADRAYNL